MKTVIVLSLTACLMSCAQDYKLGPESQVQAGIPKGTVTRHVLAPGRIYQGVPHNYAVYVPAQYSAAKPAPFMIFLDGSGSLGDGQRVPTVFDNLIAKGDMPPLIGIFIDPGVLPAVNDAAQSRYNRIFEYDNVSPVFANFLETELLPELAKSYNLSKDPSDHAIAGVSTGAVGAFVAAWERPDMFRRVLSFIGTFVSMKGADAFPAIIRRTEPKPIRVFLQAGKNDHIGADQPFGVFYGGSWPLNNQQMYEALQFSGYDVKFELGTEAHNMKHGAAIMPDALRWLWRDYGKPIGAHEPKALNQKDWEPRGQVSSIVSAAKPWEQVGLQHGEVSGVAAAQDGRVFYSGGNDIFVADATGKESMFKAGAGATALRMGADGRLYASERSKGRIVSFSMGGDEKVVAEGVDAIDFVMTAKGAIYFADPVKRQVWFVEPSGSKRFVHTNQTIGMMTSLGLTPDQAMLIVGDEGGRFQWSLQILPNGDVANGEPFYRVDLAEWSPTSQARAILTDSIGQVYFSTALGIQYCEQNGRCAGIIAKPAGGPPRAMAWGGKDLDYLYAASGGALYRRPVKIKGVAAWAVVKPPRPPL